MPNEESFVSHDDPTPTMSTPAPSAPAHAAAGAPAVATGVLRRAAAHWTETDVVAERVLELDEGYRLGALTGTDPAGDRVRVLLLCDFAGRPMLHWGLGVRSADEWRPPPASMQPVGSERFDDRAIRSPFQRDVETGLWRLELALEPIENHLPRAVNCVLYDAAHDRWFKHARRDIQLRLPRPRRDGADALTPLFDAIVEAEAGPGSWTLMHRFNLCHDLLDEAADEPDALALLFAWLRYSALRQLDWQRNYNTQPRELAHAQDRLTRRLAELFTPRTEPGLWARHMLSTVGRGGEGQQVRDRILQIMHRHHIRERHGTWIEQWHQKLHNNTTPDDIVICQAYIAFLENDGDESAYWRALEVGGVTRDRLESFERPITQRPEHHPDKKDGLLRDFHAFLRLLKSVHAGNDLETSIDAARHLLDPGLAHWLTELNQQRADTPEALMGLMESFTEARRQVADRLARQREPAAVRDLIYVDLGLEARLRAAAERTDVTHAPLGTMGHMTRLVLENLALLDPESEYHYALEQWRGVSLDDHADRDTLLLALAAAERSGRAVRAATDRLHDRLQPQAARLGDACGVDQWIVPIFSEEVVRGTLAFVLSKLMRQLEPTLRRRAGLGGWQIISGGEAVGRLAHASALRDVQDQRFDEPSVVMVDAVSGDEEIPRNVRAVLTPQTPDIVSHVAVRARNERVVLASCLDEAVWEQLQTQRGQRVRVAVTASGELHIESANEETETRAGTVPVNLVLRRPELTMQVLAPDAFTEERVGAKSRQLARVREGLPDWAHVPPMAALSFGCFEHALEASENREIAERYRQQVERIDDEPDLEPTLAELRGTIERLALPEALRTRIEAVCAEQGVTLPDERERLWAAIRSVWASKWTDRAYRARRRLGVPHDDLVMAVLLQEVVEADYAFVIHTVDPTTSDPGTLYAEVVVGLGETLVSNDPGLPLGFRMSKRARVIEWVSMPSKSVARRGRGVIARSDTNGEDLGGYAGAGLYESVLTEPATLEPIDYAREPMVCDADARARLCRSIAELGIALEEITGAAQDVEGAVRGDRFHLLQSRPQVGL